MSEQDDEPLDFEISFTDDEAAELAAGLPKGGQRYRSGVVTAALAHIGAGDNPLPCICAGCPAAIWTLGDARGQAVTAEGGITKTTDQDPWTLAVFCRAMHRDMAAFRPDYKEAAYVPRKGAQIVVGLCDAYETELEAWQKRKGGGQ